MRRSGSRTRWSCLWLALLTIPAAPASAAVADDALQLSWDGQQYAASASGAFFDLATVAPDTAVTRTLWVRNMGPSDAFLSADIVDVSLETEGSAALFGALELSWGATARTFDQLAAAGETRFLDRIPIERCASAPVTLTYRMPWEVTGANTSVAGGESASFDVRVTLTQDPADEGPPVTCSTLPETPGSGSTASAFPGTGAVMRPWIVVGLTLAAAGITLMVARRRITGKDAVHLH